MKVAAARTSRGSSDQERGSLMLSDTGITLETPMSRDVCLVQSHNLEKELPFVAGTGNGCLCQEKNSEIPVFEIRICHCPG